MDPAGTLISIATIAVVVDELLENYEDAPRVLVSIRTQIKILEAGVQRVQEWLHFTEPTSKAHVLGSLYDATATVDESIRSLEQDLDAITNKHLRALKLVGRQNSDRWTQAKFSINEGRLRKHLTDMRECVSLMHFTLTVCQLPLGHTADREIKELGIGARTLKRVHKSVRSQRQPVIAQAQPQADADSSPDFTAFIDAVLDAEKDLPDDTSVDNVKEVREFSQPRQDYSAALSEKIPVESESAVPAPIGRRRTPKEEPTWSSINGPNTSSQHDELFLPSSDFLADMIPEQARPVSSRSDIPFQRDLAGPKVNVAPPCPTRSADRLAVAPLRINAPARPPKVHDSQAQMPSDLASVQRSTSTESMTSNWPLPSPGPSAIRKPLTQKPVRPASSSGTYNDVRIPSTAYTPAISERIVPTASESVASSHLLASTDSSPEKENTTSSSRSTVWSPDSIGRATETPESSTSDGPPPYRSMSSVTAGAVSYTHLTLPTKRIV